MCFVCVYIRNGFIYFVGWSGFSFYILQYFHLFIYIEMITDKNFLTKNKPQEKIRKEKGKPLEFIVWVKSTEKQSTHTTQTRFPFFPGEYKKKKTQKRKTPEKTQNTEKTTKIVVLLVFV